MEVYLKYHYGIDGQILRRYTSVTWNIWHVLFLHKSFFKLCLRKWAACQRTGKSFAWRPLLGALWLAEMRLRLGAWTTGWHTLLPCNRWLEDISKFETLSYFDRISFCTKALDLQMYNPFRLQFHRPFFISMWQVFLEELKLLIASSIFVGTSRSSFAISRPPVMSALAPIGVWACKFQEASWVVWTQRIGEEGLLPGCCVAANSS